MLSENSQQTFHRFRQAIYLYFTGKTSSYVTKALSPDWSDIGEQRKLALIGEGNLLKGSTRNESLEYIKSRLVPLVSQVEKRDPRVQNLFRSYKKILVIDRIDKPVFSTNNISDYLKKVKEEEKGSYLIRWYDPL